MSRAGRLNERDNLAAGVTPLRTEAEAVKKVDVGSEGETTKICHTRSPVVRKSSLPAWLAASKAALAASQADHMETQRRISKLQEATKGLSIIDFSKDGRDKLLHTDGGLRAAGGEDTTAENRGGAGGTSHPPHLHELHRLTTGVIAEVASFLDPPAVVSYGMTCKAAEDVFWQDECWGDMFRVRNLRVVGDVTPLPVPAAPPPALNRERDTAVSAQRLGRGGPKHAPLRRAVIAHACALSRALRLFDVAVTDGGTTKAVINGPARTVAAVASLQSLVEISANTSDPVCRKAFSNVRTGQLLLSIVTRPHGSAVLQDLACAVLGNLFCSPDSLCMTEGAVPADDLDSPDNGVAEKLLIDPKSKQGRRRGPVIQALTALCSSTRPSPSSWFSPKSNWAGMRPVENLPGKQASRALVNLLLPRYQVSPQTAGVHHSRQPIARRRSLPTLPSPTRQNPCQDPTALGRSPEDSFLGQFTAGNGETGSPGHRRLGVPPASTVWAADISRGGSSPSGDGERRGFQCTSDCRRSGCSGGGRGSSGGQRAAEGAAGDLDTPFPDMAAPPAGKGLVQLLKAPGVYRPSPLPGSSVPAPKPRPTLPVQTATFHPPLDAEITTESAIIREFESQRSESLPLIANTRGGSGDNGAAARTIPGFPSASLKFHCERRSAEDGEQLEETWEAFYFYHSGGMKDNFSVTLRPSRTSEGGISGRGMDKLGSFAMEGNPLLGCGKGDTWFFTKTYTGRGSTDAIVGGGSGWSGGAHVTHTAYLTNGLGDDGAAGNTANRHLGYWGVWEPVLSRAGGGDASSSSTPGARATPDRWKTTLGRRGGVFRLVPSR